MAIKVLGSIKTVKLGACGAAGAMGATLTAVGKLVKDSINLIFDEPTKTNIAVEEVDDPIVTLVEQGNRRFEFSTHDYDPDVLAKFFGGAVVTGKWSAPVSITPLEQSVEITTKDIDGYHFVVTIPRALVTASMSGKIAKNGLGEVKVVCEVLTPFDGTGTALSAIQMESVAAS